MKHSLLLSLIAISIFIFYIAVIKKQNPIRLASSKIKSKPTTQQVVNRLTPTVTQRLLPQLHQAGFSTLPDRLLLIAYKKEQILKVYGLHTGKWQLIKTYPFTATSGNLGPKLKEGDKQIPEGIYNIEYLNPASLFYLSMKVSYPNDFDKAKGLLDNRQNLGGDIFIHGKAATIGCIPIGDEAIEELFILVEAADSQNTKVIIAPSDFTKGTPYPKITSVSWSKELYDKVKKELDALALQG